MLRWMGTAFAAGLLATGSAIWADDDVVRLGGPAAQTSIQGGTDTELVRGGGGHGGGGHGHGGGFHGGYHGGGFHGGYYGGYRGGYYGGYGRGYGYYGARYYSPYFSVGFYGRPYYGYGGYGYGGYGYGNYYSPYTYASYYSYPCAGQVAPALTLQTQAPLYAPSYAAPAPQQYMPPANTPPGNFQYDGGPREPVPSPIPGTDTNPAKTPRAIIPLDGKLVSQPIGGGFSPVSVAPQAKTSVPRVSYPAYGEQR